MLLCCEYQQFIECCSLVQDDKLCTWMFVCKCQWCCLSCNCAFIVVSEQEAKLTLFLREKHNFKWRNKRGMCWMCRPSHFENKLCFDCLSKRCKSYVVVWGVSCAQKWWEKDAGGGVGPPQRGSTWTIVLPRQNAWLSLGTCVTNFATWSPSSHTMSPIVPNPNFAKLLLWAPLEEQHQGWCSVLCILMLPDARRRPAKRSFGLHAKPNNDQENQTVVENGSIIFVCQHDLLQNTLKMFHFGFRWPKQSAVENALDPKGGQLLLVIKRDQLGCGWLCWGWRSSHSGRRVGLIFLIAVTAREHLDCFQLNWHVGMPVGWSWKADSCFATADCWHDASVVLVVNLLVVLHSAACKNVRWGGQAGFQKHFAFILKCPGHRFVDVAGLSPQLLIFFLQCLKLKAKVNCPRCTMLVVEDGWHPAHQFAFFCLDIMFSQQVWVHSRANKKDK